LSAASVAALTAPIRTCYTINDLAERLKVNSKTVHKWMAAGKLPPPLPFPRCHRWDVESFERWLAAQQEGADNATA
jgi:hypothetical protein